MLYNYVYKDEADFDPMEALERLQKEDSIDKVNRRKKEMETKRERKRKEKERKQAILNMDNETVGDDGHSDSGGEMNEDTQKFLDALTNPDGENSDDNESYKGSPVQAKKRRIESETEDEYSDEDEQFDTEQLEKIALAQL